MLISHYCRCAGQVIALCAALCSPSHAAPDPGTRRATAAEITDVTTRALSAFKDRDDVPDGPGLVLAPEKTLYWSAPQGGRLLALVTARFKGVTNGYCRLVTVENGHAAPVLVDLPPDVNADNCRGFRDVRYLDINGDGQLDVAATMTVKANAFDGDVDQPVVYLSDAGKGGGYCYSEGASRSLEPAVMGAVDKVRHALDRARKRRGGAQFDCAADGAP